MLDGHLKIKGYVKKQENILRSSAKSAQLEHISVLYCFFCVYVCLCVGGGDGREGG